MLYGKRLKPGDTIGLVAPSGAVRTPGALERSVAELERMGYRVKLGKSCGQVYGYLSGADEVRARDINDMFLDDAVDAIVCVRGGYGATRILDRLDYAAIAAHPKIFMGFSDITALHVMLNEHVGLCTFHGPMAKSSPLQPGATLDSLMHAIGGTPDAALRNLNGAPLHCLREGVAEGQLVGGNLTLVTSLVGTPYGVKPEGKLLFLEDVGERTYVIDRYLHQLYNAGILSRCAGIILGGFTDCEVEDPAAGLTLDEVFRDVFAKVHVPVISGLQAGHMRDMVTLPLGRRFRMDAAKGEITLID